MRHSIVRQRKALTAIVEGPSCLSSTLGGGSAGSRNFLDSRPGLCKPRSFIPTLCRHFLNVERPWGESTASRWLSERVTEVEGTGKTPDRDITCNWPGNGASSSWGLDDGDCSSVNMEIREECTVTNLVIVEFMDGRARLHVGLCHRENPLRGENE